MRKSFGIILAFFLCFTTVCFATDVTDDDVIASDEDVIIVDDPDDANDIFDGVGTQDEYKEYYREYLAYSRDQDESTTVTETFKAKVIDVEPIKTEYGMDYYMPYKSTYQPIVVEILEGEYKGERIESAFYLVPDTYENTRIKEVNVGDRVFVAVAESQDDLVAYVISYDSSTSRFGAIAVVCIIAIVLLVAFLGKEKGIKTLLLFALIFDLIFVITIPEFTKSNEIITLESGDENFPTEEEIENDITIAILDVDENDMPIKVEVTKKSNNAFLIILIDVVLVIFVNVINKLGLGKNTIKAFGIALCIVLITTLITLGVTHFAKLNGNSFEAVSVAENIINKNIDFNAIYMLSILLIEAVVASNIVSEVISNDEDVEKNKKILEKQVNVIFIFGIMLLMPKVLALTVYKYSLREMLNSEMVGLEVARVLILLISTAITLPITSYIMKKINKEEK